MSSVVGVDLSSHVIDLVKLDENTARAEWVRVELTGKTAWERTLSVPAEMFQYVPAGWFEDVYLLALEAPYGRGQAGTTAVLNRVVGAIAASLPAHLRAPERCWIVAPHEWKAGLGLKGKPTVEDVTALAFEAAGAAMTFEYSDQNSRDAYCLAMYARDTNAKAVEKALAG